MMQLSRIRETLGQIRESITVSPLIWSETFSEVTGNSIFLKLESAQRTGAFKERGALAKILTLTEEERSRGIITASAGNHARAVARHASRLGIRARIYMPLTTPLVKVAATRSYGAEVVLEGDNYDESFEAAMRSQEQHGFTFLHPFDDEAIIAGQGTLGIEMLEQNPDLEVILCPIGGGGLLGGISCAAKEIKPTIEVVGVQTVRLPSMQAAIEADGPVTLPAATTIGDGIAVRRAGTHTLPLIRKYVDGIVTVEEEEIANAILLLLEREKTLAEGAGAAALAALIHHKTPYRGKRIGVVISGGNIDVTLLSRIIERGLVKDGRLLRLRVFLRDFPGSLHRLTKVIAEHSANIVETMHDRAYYGVNLGDTAIDVTMETRGPEHIEEILEALDAAGYEHERVK